MLTLSRFLTRSGIIAGAAVSAHACLPQIFKIVDSRPAKVDTTLRLVPISSDTRLEDIQESRDGTRLLTHDRGYAPKLWDTKSLSVLAVLGSKSGDIRRTFFTPDGTKIITISRSEVHIWDGKVAHDLFSIKMPFSEDGWWSAAVSADNRMLALGTTDGRIGICSLANPSTIKFNDGHSKSLGAKDKRRGIADLNFSPDGKYLVSGSYDGTAKIWTASGEIRHTLTSQTSYVQWARVSPDSKQVLTTSSDNTACLYDIETGKLVYKKAHVIGAKGFLSNTLMSALFVGPNGDGVLCAAESGLMEVFDRKSGQKIRELKGHTQAVREIRQSRDMLKVATYGTDEQLKIWDAVTGKELPFNRGEELPTAGEFSSDGSVFWIGSEDGSINRHDIVTGKIASQRVSNIRRLNRVHLSKDRQTWWIQFAGSGGLSPTYASISFRPENPKDAVQPDDDDGHPIFSPNGQLALTIRGGASGGTLIRYDTRKNIIHFKAGILGGCFTADSKYLLTWHESKNYILWDIATGESVHSWQIDDCEPGKATISPDGKTVITDGNPKNSIYVWSMDTGKLFYRLKDQHAFGKGFVFSPDSSKFAIYNRATINVYGLKNDTPLQTLSVPDVTGKDAFLPNDLQLCWIANGTKVAAIFRDRIAVWAAATGKLEYYAHTWRAATDIEPELIFSPDGTHVLLSEETKVQVVNMATG